MLPTHLMCIKSNKIISCGSFLFHGLYGYFSVTIFHDLCNFWIFSLPTPPVFFFSFFSFHSPNNHSFMNCFPTFEVTISLINTFILPSVVRLRNWNNFYFLMKVFTKKKVFTVINFLLNTFINSET